MPIRRRPDQAAAIDTTRLFHAVREDNAEAVMRLLAGAMDCNVRHPQTGETVILTAARCGARRVVNSLLHDDSREVVDEPVGMQCADGTLHEVRATDVAAAHARAFNSASMSLWHLVQQQIEIHESSGKERLKSGLRGLSHAHTRRASGDARTSPPLEDKEVLLKRLDEMIERIRPLIEMKPTAKSGAAPGEKEGEFIGCDVKAILKQEREALQTLRPALQRWSDFIRQLIEIGARPLSSPHVKPGTLHDPATLDREGELEPLLESLKRRSLLGQDAGDPTSLAAATKALNAAMARSTRAGASHRPSQQQVLLAQSYFERLPDDLLHDRLSLQRHLHSVLELADETHGGRPDLVEKMASALQAFDELTQAAAHTRKLYQGVSYSTGDPRADTQALAVQVNNKISEARSQERQALAIVRSACAEASPRIDDCLQQAAALRAEADAVPADAQAATALRSRAEELEAKADALDGSRVRDYRVLKQYVELEKSDPADLEVQAWHLMAACLRLAAQFADHRDGFGKSGHRLRDMGLPDELLVRHAERQVLRALDYRLAAGLVGIGLPNAQLHCAPVQARSQSLPSPSPGRQHFFSGASPRFSLGRRLSPTPK